MNFPFGKIHSRLRFQSHFPHKLMNYKHQVPKYGRHNPLHCSNLIGYYWILCGNDYIPKQFSFAIKNFNLNPIRLLVLNSLINVIKKGVRNIKSTNLFTSINLLR